MLVFRTVLLAGFALVALVLALLNLKSASAAKAEGDAPWMRYYLLVSNVWSAVALVIAAVSVGGLP